MEKSQAEVFKFGILSGTLGIQPIVRWADDKIASGKNEYKLIEVSTATNENDLLTILSTVEGDIEYQYIINSCLGILANYFEAHKDDVKIILKGFTLLLSQLQQYIIKNEVEAYCFFSDMYEDYINTQMTDESKKAEIIENIKKELKRFLEKYVSYYKSIFDHK